jgi:hypothetical protein
MFFRCFSCKIKVEHNEWLGQADIVKKFLDDIRSFQKRSTPGKTPGTGKKAIEDKDEEHAKVVMENRHSEKKSTVKIKSTHDVYVKVGFYFVST